MDKLNRSVTYRTVTCGEPVAEHVQGGVVMRRAPENGVVFEGANVFVSRAALLDILVELDPPPVPRPAAKRLPRKKKR